MVNRGSSSSQGRSRVSGAGVVNIGTARFRDACLVHFDSGLRTFSVVLIYVGGSF